MDYEHVRARLRDLFARSGMTQKDFAAASELTQSTVTRLLSGKRAPELETLVKICAAFGLEPAYFVVELQQLSQKPLPQLEVDLAPLHTIRTEMEQIRKAVGRLEVAAQRLGLSTRAVPLEASGASVSHTS